MTYQYGGPGWYSTQSPAAYGAYPPQVSRAANQRTNAANRAIWLIFVLGLATYVLSYSAAAPFAGISWATRFSMLAALAAALGLLPRQSAHTKSMSALAVMGFVEALAQLVTGDQSPNWATIVIVVLTALQALTAIAVLLIQLRTLGAVDEGTPSYDEVYASDAQAAQRYYAAHDQRPVQAQGTAQAQSAASAQAQQSAAARYALYTEYLNAQQSGPHASASSPQSGQRAQTTQPAAGTNVPTSRSAESIRPETDSPTGSSTQAAF
ncbi:DUF5336 domain-containing protein [Mycobacterium heidelbergense]|uniref:DUF5336 domain-containing protein n=1 Tax=Mycobacterium heidelbergense TaxID=53376 RepID=UPI003CEA2CF2